MPVVKIYDIEGKVIEEHEVPLSFEPKPSDEMLFSKAIKRQLANARKNLAAVKTKGEVSGGGAKPWRQKGTGKARHGSRTSPIWRGGGITFGPGDRNFTEKMNKKERRRAMQIGLMSKILSENFVIVDELKMETPSTKETSRILSNLQMTGEKTLFLASREEENLMFSFRNIRKIECLPADRVNGFSLANNLKVLATRKAYEFIEEVWLS